MKSQESLQQFLIFLKRSDCMCTYINKSQCVKMAYLLCRYLKYNRIQAHKRTRERREERVTNILNSSSEILVIPNVSEEKDV